jgi:hypothetical protein
MNIVLFFALLLILSEFRLKSVKFLQLRYMIYFELLLLASIIFVDSYINYVPGNTYYILTYIPLSLFVGSLSRFYLWKNSDRFFQVFHNGQQALAIGQPYYPQRVQITDICFFMILTIYIWLVMVTFEKIADRNLLAW